LTEAIYNLAEHPWIVDRANLPFDDDLTIEVALQ
jgi:hypothetical protein